jgi:hypothetical protein
MNPRDTPKAFFHIGYPKTATTAIQGSLFYNEAILAEHGLVYPKQGIALPEYGHHNLLWSLAWEGQDCRRFRPEFGGVDAVVAAVTRSPHSCVLSSEAMAGFLRRYRGAAIDWLRLLASRLDREPVVIVVARREDLRLESAYLQSLHQWAAGINEKRPRAYSEALNWITGSARRILDPLPLVLDSGIETIVLDYSKTIVHDFFSVLGVAADDLDCGTGVDNVRRGRQYYGAIHLLANDSGWEQHAGRLRLAYPEFARRFADDGAPFRFFSLGAVRDLERSLQPVYREIASRYGICLSGLDGGWEQDWLARPFLLEEPFTAAQVSWIDERFGIDLEGARAREMRNVQTGGWE